LFLVPAADPVALATMLGELAADPARVALAAAVARPVYERHFSAKRSGERWGELLQRAEELHAQRRA